MVMSMNQMPDNIRLPAAVSRALAELDNPISDELALHRLWFQILRGDGDITNLTQFFIGYNTLYNVDDRVVRKFIVSIVAARRKQIAELRDIGFRPVSNLTLSFRALRNKGVLALEDYTCCEECGHDGAAATLREDPRWLAYIFFHHHDTEELVYSGETFMTYHYNPVHMCGVGQWESLNWASKQALLAQHMQELFSTLLVPTLNKYGIAVEWNGNPGTRIHVRNAFFFREPDPVFEET